MTGSAAPDVSVVIPTHGRPDMVPVAVRSALAQTHPALEVIVVVDGEDPDTAAALAVIDDTRLRVVRPGRHLGNAGARNAGLAQAQGDWIALLDDDDLWMPDKIARQLDAARAAQAQGLALPIVSCRFIARGDAAEFIWPRCLPRPGQPISEYLFCRRRPATGDGVVQTSTVLAPRALFDAVAFDPDCRRFVDIDWLLRAVRIPGTGVVFADPDRPLSVWRMEDRPRISNQGAWRDDVAWIEARRDLVTPRATAAFLLTLPSLRAARAGDRSALPALLLRALRAGRPSAAEVVFHIANLALPDRVKRALAARNGKRTAR